MVHVKSLQNLGRSFFGWWLGWQSEFLHVPRALQHSFALHCSAAHQSGIVVFNFLPVSHCAALHWPRALQHSSCVHVSALQYLGGEGFSVLPAAQSLALHVSRAL